MTTLFVGAERPGLDVFWLDSTKTPVDFSTGTWTFAVSIEQADVETVVSGATVATFASPTKDTGSSADIPSLQVTFAAGAIDSLVVGTAIVRINATSAGRNRRWKQTVRVES